MSTYNVPAVSNNTFFELLCFFVTEFERMEKKVSPKTLNFIVNNSFAQDCSVEQKKNRRIYMAKYIVYFGRASRQKTSGKDPTVSRRTIDSMISCRSMDLMG